MSDSKQPEIRRWLPNASDEYITARRKLLDAERALSEQTERVAAQRRALPAGPALQKDYTLTDASVGTALDPPRTVQFSALVPSDTNRSLVVYHLMLGEAAEEACASCCMWVDGFNGVAAHLAQSVDVVVVAKAPAAKLQAWAAKRGWKGLKVLSSFGSDFNADLNVEAPNWAPEADQTPATSVFKKDAETGVVRFVYTQVPDWVPGAVRGMDAFCSVWNVLDLTPEGRGDWNPSNKYIKTV